MSASAPAESGLAPRSLGLVCPQCRCALVAAGDALRCDSCSRTFSGQGGIPDLRVFPDPYLSVEEDRERTAIVLEALERLPLPDLLRLYWSFSDITPPALREQFTRSALFAEEKGQRLLGLLESGALGASSRPLRRVLEIGSGTGGFLAVAGARFDDVVGVDIAMRWLHVSRRRFRDRDQRPPLLVCACAERLPFPDRSFDLVVSSATLEFTRDPRQVLAETARVLTDEGLAIVNTVNRFSLAPEPHVNLWGLGFLPRSWQDRYVRWRRGVGFRNIRPLSYAELKRIAAPHFSSVVVAPADVPDAVLESLPAAKRAQVRVYRLLRRLQPFAGLLARLGPEWDVALRK